MQAEHADIANHLSYDTPSVIKGGQNEPGDATGTAPEKKSEGGWFNDLHRGHRDDS